MFIYVEYVNMPPIAVTADTCDPEHGRKYVLNTEGVEVTKHCTHVGFSLLFLIISVTFHYSLLGFYRNYTLLLSVGHVYKLAGTYF